MATRLQGQLPLEALPQVNDRSLPSAAAGRFGVPFWIAVPAAVPAAATLVVIVVVVTRARASKPAFVIARARIAVIFVVVAITAARAAALFPAAT